MMKKLQTSVIGRKFPKKNNYAISEAIQKAQKDDKA